MNSIVKNTIILTVITLISGVLLGSVYQLTKEPIALQQEMIKQEAYKTVMEEAEKFETSEELMALAGETLEEAGIKGCDINEVVIAKDGADMPVGYIFGVTTHEGYGGDINISVGIDTDGYVTGIEILSISETAGLGMRANTPEFKEQFEYIEAQKITLIKEGEDSDADNTIDALSGATITSKAMTNAVNSAIAVYNSMEGGSDDE